MKPYFEGIIIDINDNIYRAHWMLHRNGRILVVENNGKFEGIITFREINETYNNTDLSVSDICNRNCFVIRNGNIYEQAKLIFADNVQIRDIPVIDDNGELSDIVSREQVFWRQYYREFRLPRMHYAYCIYNAAFEAKSLGYDAISVIEFGVAGGNGLLNCEFHAREIERIFGISIEIYGFDSGVGLPIGNMGYKDMIHIWPDQSYKMDIVKLKKRLRKAKLIIGNLNDTAKVFFNNYKPAPIGCMLIDVDRYSSSIPIMRMLEADNSYYLPRVHMYFDDVMTEYEFQGEGLAIKEFNERNKNLKISPEGMGEQGIKRKIKTCHRFEHEKYNQQIMLSDGLELTPESLELPLLNGIYQFD